MLKLELLVLRIILFFVSGYVGIDVVVKVFLRVLKVIFCFVFEWLFCELDCVKIE